MPTTMYSDTAELIQVQARQGGSTGAEVLLGYRTSSLELVAHHDPHTKVVASAILLGWY